MDMIFLGDFLGDLSYIIIGTKDLSILGIIHISFVRDSSFDGDMFFLPKMGKTCWISYGLMLNGRTYEI